LIYPPIGGGSFGTVYLALTLTNTYRAIKVVRRDRFTQERPFRQEFDGLLKFEPISRTHPGFVSILYVGQNQEDAYFYYIMEAADDIDSGPNLNPKAYQPKTLSLALHAQGRLPVRECMNIGLSLTDALGCLHQHGLVHRDIKPANIIFVRGVPKLADIGLVTAIEAASFVGTEGYVPTEGPGRPPADIYALGKVLYVISTGQDARQFPELPSDLQAAIAVAPYRQFFDVLLKGCADNVRERFQSAQELHDALARVAQAPAEPTRVIVPPPPEPISSPKKSAHVCIAYKAHAEPDGHLLRLLEGELTRHGHKVFIDRHLSIGVHWAEEIEKRIRGSDSVIVLLSKRSIESEMVAYEVEIANDEAQKQQAQKRQAKPALLPIRVDYIDPLSESLERILYHIHQISWKGPSDDARIVEEVLSALQNPPSTVPVPVPPPPLPVGVVPLDSRFYVVRPVDSAFQTAISRQDSIVLVKGARQMGKTSLLARGLDQASKEGRKVVVTDFQKLNTAHLESAEALFKTLAFWIDAKLELKLRPLEGWSAQAGANLAFEHFMEQGLTKLSAPLVWGLDEVDRLFTCPFGSDVFGLFRSWHNARVLEPTGHLSRLTLAIAYATEANLFITDVNQSPFNVGTRLALDDFTSEQVADLSHRYNSPLRNNSELGRFFRLVDGHPFLVHRGLYELAHGGVSLEDFEAKADRDEGIFGDHLRRILVVLAKNPQLRDVMRAMLQGQPCPTEESFYRLRTAGILVGDSAREARPRCQIYEKYLARHLL
jgi:serine/threonine protein kinase